MPKKVVAPQPKVFEYDSNKIQEYLEYNYLQIVEYLRLSVDQKYMDPDLEKMLNKLFEKVSFKIRDIGRTMVFINKRDMVISRILPKNSPSAELLKFEIAVGRLYVGKVLWEIAGHFLKARKESEFERAQIGIVLQGIVVAIESLPRQNFYATFSGIKKPVE